ncbi:Uma2 family endonuclease [Kribbella capetownensis]|uniref:Uma2 family endonuclease n=1 Tax=Kribbella capetownensis TaxID=1572659 RepID=A0A4R0JJV6_9ACTN|nr:Uma2 family endonuclease [Kribbella capetownensis]TCC46587.1 Uma2 family endonuclease [Kribbella capetownensis]
MRDIDVVNALRPSQPGAFTPSDLDEVPEDVVRCELVDGSLVVRRPPSPSHQAVLLELACTLRSICPEQLQVLPAPVRFEPAAGLSLLPDILVCHRDDVGDRHVERPLLAVAIMSRSTRALDTGFRQALYDLSKVPSYWMFDPARRALTVRELVDGEYAERTVVGDEVFEATAPFAVRIVPGELVR